MKEREKLWKLIDDLTDNKIDVKVFCRDFTRIFDLEIDYDELSEEEEKAFDRLSTMTARFSAFEEDFIKYPKVYFSEHNVKAEINKILLQFHRS